MYAHINKILALFAIALGLGATTSKAVAAPITVTFEGVNPVVGNAGQYNWNTGSNTISGLLYTPNGNGSSSANHFITFCIQQNQYISGGTTYTNDYSFTSLTSAPVPGPAMSSSAANDIEQMWAEYRPTLAGSTDSAAFQHAIWHLVDPSYNPSLSGGMLTDYTAFLDSSNWNSGYANLAAMISQEHQDQILELQSGYRINEDGDIVPTPAPATLAVAVLMAPALLLRRRKAARAV